jgi:hypothetical protein
MRRSGGISVLVTMTLAASGTAYAGTSYQVGKDSQQLGPSHASAGATINVTSRPPGSPGSGGSEASTSETLGESSSPSSSGGAAASPTYTGPNAEACQSTPQAIPCYGVVPNPAEAPRKGKAKTPPVNPAVLAASAASRLALLSGKVEVSPSSSTAGLTGVASWFWLSPAPSPQSLSVSAGAEQVTVTSAIGGVRWDFGDGESFMGGPGVPYRPGTPPADSVRHVYETRCLPGDRGHDPNVSSSCGPNGYEVHAVIEWRITYRATGPIATAGALPSRSTEATMTYPVSEARAFLTKGSQ